jgi:hypothetical protein
MKFWYENDIYEWEIIAGKKRLSTVNSEADAAAVAEVFTKRGTKVTVRKNLVRKGMTTAQFLANGGNW